MDTGEAIPATGKRLIGVQKPDPQPLKTNT